MCKTVLSDFLNHKPFIIISNYASLFLLLQKFYDRKPNGLNGALQDLGISFEGREHSGNIQ